jgi:probable phosphoglycerate mutase
MSKMVAIYHQRTDVLIMPEFRERSVGIFEGLTREEAQRKYPELWEQQVLRNYEEGPPQGESVNDVETRVAFGLATLRRKHVEKTILIITHAFAGKMVHKLLHPAMTWEEFYEFKFPNAEIREYDL